MTTTDYIFTGLQPFWNYDSFSIAPRRFGGGTGYVNTAGAKITHDNQSGVYSIVYQINFMFSVSDLGLKFHNNSPFINRFYNTSATFQPVQLNNNLGLFGESWVSNYEQCLVENSGSHIVTEIGTTGERNVYTESGGAYTAPNGVLKDMTKPDASNFEILTRDYTTCRFTKLTSDESNLYRLNYIADKNDVRVYVTWELVSSKYRIKEISTSTDSGTTKTPVLTFKYRTIGVYDGQSTINRHFITEIVDNLKRTWAYTYNTVESGGNITKVLLSKVNYPTGIEQEYGYDANQTYKLATIINANKVRWEINYDISGGYNSWKVNVDSVDHITYYTGSISSSTGVMTFNRRDARSTGHTDANYLQIFTSNTSGSITGNLVSHKITETSSATWVETKYTWTTNQLTKVEEPNSVAATASDYTTYAYNSDRLLEYVKKYDNNAEQTRYRVKYAYGTGATKYELATVEKDFSGGTYYHNKTEFSYDTSHNMRMTKAGINPDTGATSDPDQVSINAITQHGYDDYGQVVKTIDAEGNMTLFEYDDLGAMIKTFDSMGNPTEQTYDELSIYVKTRKDANGNTSRFNYDALGQLLSASDPLGTVSSTTYDPNGNVISRSSPAGKVSMVYDAKNRLTKNTDHQGLTTYFDYLKNDLKSKERYYMALSDSTTATKYETTYTYQNCGRLSVVTNPLTQTTTYEYDKTGNILKVKDTKNVETVINTYDFANQLLSATYTSFLSYQGSTHYEYNGPMAMTSKVTKRSNDGSTDTNKETTFTYDRLGRLYMEVKPTVSYGGGPTITFSTLNYYDNNGNVLKVINRKNVSSTNTDRYIINEYDRLRRKIGTRTQIAEEGSVNSEQVVGTSYDAVGNRTAVAVNGQTLTKTTYDGARRAVETVHSSGHRLIRQYSSSGGVMEEWVDGIDGSFPYSVDSRGQIRSIDSADVATKKSTVYDAAGRVVSSTDSIGRTTTREYHPNGWLKMMVKPNGDAVEQVYDLLGRLTEIKELSPDPAGGAYTVRQTLHVTNAYAADYTPTSGSGMQSLGMGINLPHTYAEYISEKTSTPTYYGGLYGFDTNGRLNVCEFLAQDDSTNVKYVYTYDGFGNLVKVKKPDNGEIDYTYNGLNQMTKEDFGSNTYNEFEYCCCSLTKHKQTIGGTPEESFELTYDKMHRLLKEQYPQTGTPKTEYFEYKYDNAGRRIEMTDPTYGRAANNPKPTRWAYDEDGKLIRVSRSVDGDYHRSDGEDYHVEYDNHARISRVLYPGTDNQPVMEVEYQYCDCGQVSKIIARDLTQGVSTDIYCMEYWYDTNGRKARQVVKEEESDPDTDAYYITTFAYDSRDMLVEEKSVRWNSGNTQWDVMYWARYTYDTSGNMHSRKVDQIVNGNAKYYEDSLSYSRGYQLNLLSRSVPSASETKIYTISYDYNGNLTHIARNGTFTDSFYDITEMEFQYDKKNRMTNYRFGGSGSYYQVKYDSLGRVRERVDLTPTTTKYYYDGRQLVQQLTSGNAVQFDYLQGPTGLDRQLEVSGTKKRFYLKDPLGTVWAIVNPSTLAVTHYNYNAWGEHLDKDDADFPSDENRMRYISSRVEAFGKSTAQTDALYHLDHRHYLPVLGSFLQREPSPGVYSIRGLNVYHYSNNNPSNFTDSSGLLCSTPGCGGSSGPGITPPGPLPVPPGSGGFPAITNKLINCLIRLIIYYQGLGPYPYDCFSSVPGGQVPGFGGGYTPQPPHPGGGHGPGYPEFPPGPGDAETWRCFLLALESCDVGVNIPTIGDFIEEIISMLGLPHEVAEAVRHCAMYTGPQLLECIFHELLKYGYGKIADKLGLPPTDIWALLRWLYDFYAGWLTKGLTILSFCAHIGCICNKMKACVSTSNPNSWEICCGYMLLRYCMNPGANDPMALLSLCTDISEE